MKLPQYDSEEFTTFADGETTQGTPTYSGFTADQLSPASRTLTVDQIVNRLSSPELKVKVRSLKKKNKARKVLKHKYEVLKISDLQVDQGAYQRLENERKIFDILSDYVREAVHPPIVVRRMYNGGANILADAQQRTIATRLTGTDEIGCIIYEVNSIEEEALLFNKSNDRKTVPTPTKHKGQVQLGNPEALALEGAVRTAGMIIGEKAGNRIVKGTTRLHAIAKMYKINGKPNYPLVTKALASYSAIWPEHRSVHLYLVGGLAHLIHIYSEYRGHPRGVNQLNKVTPDGLRIIGLTEQDPIKLVKKLKDKRPAEQQRLYSDNWYAGHLYTAFNKATNGPGSLKANVLRDALALMTSK